MKSGTVFMVVFGVFWCGMTALFDGLIVRGLWQGLAAGGYATTTGVVTSSAVKVDSDGEGCTYRPEVRYRYNVGGVEHEGSRVQYGTISAGRGWAEERVRMFPAGASVPVRYDSRDAGESVLIAGADSTLVFGLVFMTPFNMVAVGGMWALWASARYRRMRPRAGGMRVVEEEGVTRVRIASVHPLAAGLGMTGVAGFVATFVVGFSTGMGPSMPVALGTLAGVVGCGVAGCAWAVARRGANERYVVIDELAGTVELPRTRIGEKREARRVGIGEVVDVRYREIGTGDDAKKVLSVFVREVSGEERAMDYLAGLDEERGRALAGFLRERMEGTCRKVNAAGGKRVVWNP